MELKYTEFLQKQIRNNPYDDYWIGCYKDWEHFLDMRAKGLTGYYNFHPDFKFTPKYKCLFHTKVILGDIIEYCFEELPFFTTKELYVQSLNSSEELDYLFLPYNLPVTPNYDLQELLIQVDGKDYKLVLNGQSLFNLTCVEVDYGDDEINTVTRI